MRPSLAYWGDPEIPANKFHDAKDDLRVTTLKETLVVLDKSAHIRSRRHIYRLCQLIANALDNLELPDPDHGCCFVRGRVACGWRLRGYNGAPANTTSRLQVVHTPRPIEDVPELATVKRTGPLMYIEIGRGEFDFDELTSV